MRICVIGNSACLNALSTIAYFQQQGDQVMLLSTASERTRTGPILTIYLIPLQVKSGSRPPGGLHHAGDTPAAIWTKRRILGAILRCRRELRRFSPDVTYCLGTFPEGFLGSCTARGIFVVQMPTDQDDVTKLTRSMRWMADRSVRSADLLVIEGERGNELIRELLGGGEVSGRDASLRATTEPAGKF